MIEEIPNLSSRPPALLLGLREPSDFYLFGKLNGALLGKNLSPQKNSFWGSGVTDSIGRTSLESLFDAWKRRLSECFQMRSEYFTEGEFESLGEKPCSQRQTEMLTIIRYHIIDFRRSFLYMQ
jgi:hypothetical protein